MNLKTFLLFPLLLFFTGPSHAQTGRKTEHIFLVTLDGLRWQELFGGAVDSLMDDSKYVDDKAGLLRLFDAQTAEERRLKLMPFFWKTIASEGQLYGNRWAGNKVNCSNGFWFSYPGYNEILTGFADPRIGSNDKIPNPNVTVLEWLSQQPGFGGRVAAFGSWDVFPFILNEERSGVPVNAGFDFAAGDGLTQKELFLNELQAQVPSPWSSVRLDAFTHGFAMEYLKKYHPKVLYIAYGETDDFAHDGRYGQYLKSARQTDKFIEELWHFAQADPVYRGKTTFIITTDHGRGANPKEQWRGHGKDHEGSDAIWLAVLGPDTPALGEIKTKAQLWQNQIARTAAAFLGLDYENKEGEVGESIRTAFEK